MAGAVRRKAGTVWTPKPADSIRRVGPSEGDLAGQLHRHGCQTCSATYSDACESPLSNRTCAMCRSGRAPLWETNLRPKECCSSSQPATPQELATYRLGGDTTWLLCPTCKRPFIYKPRKAVQ